METLKTGDLAFFDSLSGLVPCKVISITGKSGPASALQAVRFKLTVSRGRYKRGEVLSSSALHVCPRWSVHHQMIRQYQVEVKV